MEISDQLRCLFSGKVEERNGSYVIEVPEQELHLGDLEADETYRVAVLPSPTTSESTTTGADPQHEQASQTPLLRKENNALSKSKTLVTKATASPELSAGSSLLFPIPNRASVSLSRSPMSGRMSPSRKLSTALATTSSLQRSFSSSEDGVRVNVTGDSLMLFREARTCSRQNRTLHRGSGMSTTAELY